MQLQKVDMTHILKNMTIYRMMMENGTADQDIKNRVEFLENSIKVLPERDFCLIEYYCYDTIPIRKIMDKLYISKPTIYRKINKIGQEIERLYQVYQKIENKCNQVITK